MRLMGSGDAALRAAGMLIVVGAMTLPGIPRADAQPNGHCGGTAANVQRWGDPTRSTEFDDWSALADWNVYDSVGHDENGWRTPTAISFDDGSLTITGGPAGDSGGMAWLPGSLYGRWETCIRSLPGSASYHPVALLWPDSEQWPKDGEIDFMEISDAPRQLVTNTIHHQTPDPAVTYGPENQAAIPIDATQWHSWAVEWAPDHVSGYVDGTEWFRLTANIPSTPMHLCIQLDNFGGDISQGGQMMVDWAREYLL
jgi:licheninase